MDIVEIIREKRIVTYFQPVISVFRRHIIGFEALSRGMDADGRALYPPDLLFDAADNKGLLVELDRLCRLQALEAFKKLHEPGSRLLLFLNIDAAVIEQANGSNYLADSAERLDIPFSNIVIEINEMRECSSSSLADFTERYTGKGFHIALDDVGAGFSNLDRYAIVKPDIIKVDKSIIASIHRRIDKQMVFRSIADFARRAGSLIVAEGVEDEMEALFLLRFGANLLQGYLYSRPVPLIDFNFDECSRRIIETASLL